MLNRLKRTAGKTRRCVALIAATLALTAYASAFNNRIHCQEDSAFVARILTLTAQNGGTFGDRCVFAAKQFAGIPLSEPADTDSLGTIMVNFHGLDPLGFANNVMAIAAASSLSLPTVTEYEHYLEKFSRKKGVDLGFPSRLFYGADWIVDNVYRGNLKEMTEYISGTGFKVKTFDHLTRNREKYAALKNDETFDKIRMMEMGYRSHRLPYLKKQSIASKDIHSLMENGDIIMRLTTNPDTDIYDIGFIEMKEGEPYLIHIAGENGKVTVDEYPVTRLFKLENQHFFGYRWIRPTS